MMVKDCPDFFYLFWGAIKAGLVPVPINTLLRSPDYQFMMEDSACSLVIYSQEFCKEVRFALEATEGKTILSYVIEGEKSLGALARKASDHLEVIPASAEEDCFWLYSSGSTGRPKGTVHSHKDIPVTCVYYAEGVLGLTKEDICFSAAKLFFAYGLGNAMTFPLWVGATAILSAAPPSPEMTFSIIEKFKPSIYFGVPTLYAAQLQALEYADPDLTSIKICVSAGEALPGDIFRRWKEKTGTVILDGIGSTEILHIFISNFPDDVKPGVSGRLVPGYQAKILDERGEIVDQGLSGALWVKGDSVAKYYWKNPEKNLEISESPISAKNLSKLINLIKDGTISGKIAKTVFEIMTKGDKNPIDIVKEKGLKQQSDPKELEKLIEKVINENQEKVKEYKSGKEKLFGFFVGQVMKVSGGKANPQLVNEILKKKLK